MLTVACVWVKANVPYSVDYVTRLRNMVARHLPMNYRFMCLTDRPDELPADIETSHITHKPMVPGWWSKINLFNPMRMKTDDKILYLDLDTVVVDDLSPIAEFNSDLALIPTEGNFQGRNGLRVIKKFNSSCMVYNVKKCADLYNQFNVTIYTKLWGDQDWIAERRPDADMMPLEWFPRLSSLKANPPKNAKVVLCKQPKNHEAAMNTQWLREAWQ